MITNVPSGIWRNAVLASVVCIVASVAAVRAQQGGTAELTVNDPRPLAAAIVELERRYGWQVTYEDPQYEFVADVTDVTLAVRNDGNISKRVIVPAGGHFAFRYSLPGTAAPNPNVVLAQLLEAYHDSTSSARFRLIRTASVLHVVPVQSNDAKGFLKDRSSRLDRTIRVAGGRRLLEVLQDALKAASTADVELALGAAPLGLLTSTRIPDGNITGTTRDVLVNLLSTTGRPLSWQLFCQPQTTMCFVNLHVVERSGP